MMSDDGPAELDDRVLVLAPTARDGTATRDLLAAAGIHGVVCATLAEVCREAGRGAGAAVVTAEAVLGDREGCLRELLRAQRPWSDLPVIVLTPAGAESPKLLRALEGVGPMTLVQRPVQVSALVSTVRSAVRDRRRQYAVRDHLAEHRRQAEALAAAEGRLRLMVENVRDYAIFSLDTAGTVATWNSGAERVFGWPESEILGRDGAVLFTPEDRAAGVPAREQAAARERGRAEDERWHVRKDGSRFFASGVLTPILDGHLHGYAKVCRDITERKHAEEALRASEGRHRFLADLAVAVHPLTDPEEVIAAAARRLGEYLDSDRCAYAEVEAEAVYVITGDYTRGVPSIVGRWPVAAFGAEHHRVMRADEPYVVHDADADPRIGPADLPAYRATAIRSVICVPLHKAGRFTAAMAVHQSAPRRWGADEVALVREVVGRCWEALERARVERSLRASEERYRKLFTSIDEGFCVIEVLFDAADRPADYRFLEVNPAFERHTGLGDAAGKTIRELAPGHEAHWFEVYGTVARTGEPARFVNESRALGGRWFDVYAFRLGGPGSRKVAVLFNDITARRRAEDALRDADRRKDEFMAMLAHELRNPLAPLRNALQILSLRGGDPGVVDQVREMMERQVGHLGRLVDDLLDVSRITTGKVQLRRERLDLARLARQEAADHRVAFAAKGVSLAVTAPAEAVWVSGDPVRLAQILDNLLTNALKFTARDGAVSVAVAAGLAGRAVVTVRDTGAGIEAEMLARLFEPFSQADRTLDRSPGGLGLGLAIVKGLAELHGGSVRAESGGLGRGSVFTVTLPAFTEVPALTGRPAPARPAARRLRVLVVEDNRDAADSLRLLLEAYGYEVSVAYTGPDGVRAAVEHRPEVVVCDIGLPGMDGYRVAEALRGNPATAASRLIALTGYGRDEDRRRARDAGFDEHLTKPADPAALEALIAAG
jgi:PAS domain S-box-containing protein